MNLGNTFNKKRKLCSQKAVERLFSGGSMSFSSYPLRLVAREAEDMEGERVAILISVPKKRFHHAVDRNRCKRQVRESFRLGQKRLMDYLEERGLWLDVAFVWTSSEHAPSDKVSRSVGILLSRLVEKLEKNK